MNMVNMTVMIDLGKQRKCGDMNGRSQWKEGIEYGQSPCKYSWGTQSFDANREPKKLVSAKLKCGSLDCVTRCQKIPLCLTVLRKQSGCIWKIDQEEIAIGYYPK